MLIRDNPSSRRSLRSYHFNRGKLSKTLEKLSSGYQINRSADDAAGLAVSEKMRANITGLERAKTNSMEGIDLLQVGEGALDEIHQLLNRAAFLVDSSANGTYTDALDRQVLQRELDQICDEIDRIARNTRFNTVHLFQNKGYDYETSKGAASAIPVIQTPVPDETPSSSIEIDANAVNIVYTEHASVTATPSGNGTDGLKGMDKTVTYADGTTKQLSKVLEEEIVPNIVKNVLRNYPAFSYLNGSTIGIGLGNH